MPVAWPASALAGPIFRRRARATRPRDRIAPAASCRSMNGRAWRPAGAESARRCLRLVDRGQGFNRPRGILPLYEWAGTEARGILPLVRSFGAERERRDGLQDLAVAEQDQLISIERSGLTFVLEPEDHFDIGRLAALMNCEHAMAVLDQGAKRGDERGAGGIGRHLACGRLLAPAEQFAGPAQRRGAEQHDSSASRRNSSHGPCHAPGVRVGLCARGMLT